MSNHHNHHNHPSHVHNFLNKHTAFAILIMIVGFFLAGYFVGTRDIMSHHGNDYKGYNVGGDRIDFGME